MCYVFNGVSNVPFPVCHVLQFYRYFSIYVYNLSYQLCHVCHQMWHSIGVDVTKPPPDTVTRGCDAFVPTQAFLTALLHTLPHLFHHIKHRYGVAQMTLI